MRARNRNRRKPGRKRRAEATTGDLREQVRRLLASGDARGALGRLKQVPDGEKDASELAFLHFRALALRARQLTALGEEREAERMRTRAAQHRDAVLPETLAEEDLLHYLRYLGTVDAVSTYAAYSEARPPFAAAERLLADRLVTGRRWEALDVLDENHVLRRHADHVMRGLDAMDAGEWAQGNDLLRALPRQSPFAAWRVFCKCMASFRAGDDAGLRRALALLPDDFALAGTVAELRLCAGGGGKGGPAGTKHALGTQGATVAALGAELRRSLHGNGRPRDIERRMGRLADALCPGDPIPALVDLMQIAGLAAGRDYLSLHTLARLAQQLLPARRVPGVMSRIDLVLQQKSVNHWDPAPAAILLERLSTEFPEAGDRPLARGRVLEALARNVPRTKPPEVLFSTISEALTPIMGGRPVNPLTLPADLMEASLAADPLNREGWRFLVELLRGGKRRDQRLRRVLEDMAAQFPADAEPWIELAMHHYSGNAHRQAERALAQARRRAPHDERVADLQAVGFLKSADQSRNRNGFELAARDLERASELSRPRLDVILQAKRLMFEIVSSGRAVSEAVEPHLNHLSPDVQIRVLSLLLRDLDGNSHVQNVDPAMTDGVRALLDLRGPALEELDAVEAAGLLAPLPADVGILFKTLHVAPVLSDWWTVIMRRQSGETLLGVFDILMDCGGRSVVRSEIGRRLSATDRGRRDPLLLLYLAVIRYQEGDDHDSRRFVESLEAAGPSGRERLRAAAARLTHFATGVLREALADMDFTLLDPIEGVVREDMPLDIESLHDEMEELLENIDDFMDFTDIEDAKLDREGLSLEDFLDRLKAGLWVDSPDKRDQDPLFDTQAMNELDALENLFDRYQLRDAPALVLYGLAEMARTDPEIRRNLDRTASRCEKAGLRGGLTREAQAFLFSGAPGRRRREGV